MQSDRQLASRFGIRRQPCEFIAECAKVLRGLLDALESLNVFSRHSTNVIDPDLQLLDPNGLLTDGGGNLRCRAGGLAKRLCQRVDGIARL